MSRWRLIGDVGGSNARFARASGGVVAERRKYLVKDFPSFYDTLHHYLADTGGAEGCTSAAICAAGMVEDGAVALTNAPWTIEAREIGQLLGGLPATLINDLQGVAMALPHLPEKEITQLGPARGGKGRRPMLALNVGTGFGAAAAVHTGQGWISVGCEPGHMALGATDADELSVIAGFPTVEDLLSGRGVSALYKRLAERGGRRIDTPPPGSEVFASVASDPVAAETVRYFSKLLGRIAGDLMLATGSWGGVFLCGSVVRGWAQVADIPAFRAAFEAKGPMTERAREVFTGFIEMHDISLFGLSHMDVAA